MTQLDEQKLRDLLVTPGYIAEKEFNASVTEASSSQKELIDVLVDSNLIKDEEFGKLVADDLNLNFVDLRKEKTDAKTLHIIPETVAKSRKAIAFKQNDQGLHLAMSNPDDWELKNLIEKKTGQTVLTYYATDRDIHLALGQYRESLSEVFESILTQMNQAGTSREQQDELTIKMVNSIIEYGYYNQASDIHIEPYEEEAVVRFRIDGLMHKVVEMPKKLHDSILQRIKVLAKMRIDEHYRAQDGKLRYKVEGETLDIRVSVLPIVEGENVVMRLLSSATRQYSLQELGLDDKNLKIVDEQIKHPHGMILTTGPSGSGKTTTLYAILKILNQPEVHIATIEDPVEYDIEGISQTQVNTKTNLTFAEGLRSLVRQDPDIIMVGEIRDEETADIAVNSALTGHLVLSTLHTNDAPTTLPRFIEMQVEPFLVASTINVIIAQRLVRKICEKCRVSSELEAKDKTIIKNDHHIKELFEDRGYKDLKKVRVYKGMGCQVCANTGYSGRIGIFEVLEMQENIKELVLQHASSDKIMKQAQNNGMTKMLEDGINKVLNGITTLEEVLRVTRE
ncbi:type II/IV secretion system protein [candidate division WWE3 bacterium]|uniref:Type II/IV secretion system protein n=1 Tax=candidate division WWE3 bacterium TaxID=2053526 RepID=A0A955LJD7_UNCKA|nr:type II/IV secretion system protein [candidate division WWE3 bacterium]